MSNVIEFNNVWKKFKKGEKFNSIRDAVPNFAKKVLKMGVGSDNELEEREFWAVKDVNFNVKKGEVVGIIGPNGAGKSTILKLLSGIIVPNQGNLSIEGRLSALIEVTAGFHPELTGRENIYLNGTILGMKKAEIDSKFEDIVKFSGIGEFIDTPIKRYSSGMYSRLGFSVAANVNPDVLLVDEVLAVGDIAFQSKCAQKMRELLESGTTIVIVSHNLSLIESLCDRAILLDKGQVIKEGATDQVIPYYEKVIFDRTEEEFKGKIDETSHKVQIEEKQSAVEITEVQFLDSDGNEKDSFDVGEELLIRIKYNTEQEINNPIFVLDFWRADGVLCCSSNSEDDNCNLGKILGAGKVDVNLGKVNVHPGVYVMHISIWSEDRIHAYAIRKKDVLRVSMDGKHKNSKSVFVVDYKWGA